VAIRSFLDERSNQSDRIVVHERWPLSAAEHAALISQIAISKSGRGGRRKLPWVFTEHGAIQAVDILEATREFMNPPAPGGRGIGFTADLK
jgi:hypothetical protein